MSNLFEKLFQYVGAYLNFTHTLPGNLWTMYLAYVHPILMYVLDYSGAPPIAQTLQKFVPANQSWTAYLWSFIVGIASLVYFLLVLTFPMLAGLRVVFSACSYLFCCKRRNQSPLLQPQQLHVPTKQK